MKFTTPLLLLVFNRPDTTQRVFEEIRKAQPSQLFVAADGPRKNRPTEAEKCEQVRKIIETVDWECEVVTLYRETNLGCRKAVSSAIDWFFEKVEEGIILEDDCLPSTSFFPFCQELLERYRHDTRVMQICGMNILKEWCRSDYSYFFSSYGPVWGWASWRRAWKHYDVEMKIWPEIRDTRLYIDFSQSDTEAIYRRDLYERVATSEIDTWDYQWGFAKMINSGMSVIPEKSLVQNIGFGTDATHTCAADARAEIGAYEIDFPLRHPSFILRDKDFDKGFNSTYLPKANSLMDKILHYFSK